MSLRSNRSMTVDLSAEKTYHIDYLVEIFDQFRWTIYGTAQVKDTRWTKHENKNAERKQKLNQCQSISSLG